MPLHSISQETVFYTGFWDRQKERFLFGKFEFETWMGNWVPGQHEVNKAVVDRTRPAFRHQYDVDLPIEEYNRKYDEWSRRYDNFKWLISQRGVYYNELENRVYANDAKWETLIQARPEIAAYLTDGETNWWYMKRLFQTEEDDPESTVNNPSHTPSTSGQQSRARLDDNDEDSVNHYNNENSPPHIIHIL